MQRLFQIEFGLRHQCVKAYKSLCVRTMILYSNSYALDIVNSVQKYDVDDCCFKLLMIAVWGCWCLLSMQVRTYRGWFPRIHKRDADCYISFISSCKYFYFWIVWWMFAGRKLLRLVFQELRRETRVQWPLANSYFPIWHFYDWFIM